MAGGPAMNSGLLANLVARVVLAAVGILLCWVPFRLLLRNGEFAAVVLIVDVVIMNSITIINSLIWHNDDWSSWWDGAGFCDVEVYLAGPLQSIYAASIFTVMYHLAQQVKIARPGRSRSEKTRRNLIQAAIIFPIPIVQLSFTNFDLAQRYIVGTLVGCSAVYDTSWPKNLVYDAPPAVFAVLSVPYAVLLWRRYNAITKQTRLVLKLNSEASVRASRTRRRLYKMSLSILIIYLPVMLYYLIYNIEDTLYSYKAYDYHRIRESATPYPWDTILFVPSWIIPSAIMNQPWIPIATSVAIVSFFGTTVEARETYWRYATYLRIEPLLRKLGSKKIHDTGQTDGNTGTRGSGRILLPQRPRNSIETHRRQNSGNPVIQRPERVLLAEPRGFSPAPAPGHRRMAGPHAIPPRFSSLRNTFTFQAPTLQSIRQAIRIPSLRGRNGSATYASGASNKTAGNRSEFSRDGSIPMLPLYASRQRGAELPRPPEPVLTRGADTDSTRSRHGSRLQIRIPIVRPSTSIGMDDARGADRESFSRERTLSTLFTSSDTRMDQIRALPRANGIAK